MEKSPIDIFKEVEKLGFPAEEFLLVGSAILSVKGIRESYDLDIVVSQSLFDTCLKNGWELKPWTRTGAPGKAWLQKGNVDLMLESRTNTEGFDLDRLKRDGEKINGVWFLSIPQLIMFKKDYGREKDFADVALMEKYMRAKRDVSPSRGRDNYS